MKIKTFLFLLFVLQFNLCFARQFNSDSLLKTINTSTNDYNKAELYNLLGNTYRRINLDSAIKYTTLAEQISVKNKYPDQLAEAYIEKGIALYKKGIPDSSFFLLDKAYEVASQSGDYRRMLKSLNSIGLHRHNEKEYEKAYDAFNEALEYVNLINDKELISMLFNNLAMNHRATHKTDLALETYHKALIISEERKDKRGISIISSNMGLLYQSQGKTELALSYLNRSLQIRQENEDIRGQAIVLINLGVVYEEIKDFNKALNSYRKALTLKKELNLKRSVAKLYNNIAIVYKEMAVYDSAFYYCRESYKQRLELKDESGIAHTQTTLAQLYFLHGDYINAQLNFKEAYVIAKKHNDLRLLHLINKGLYKTSYNQGDYKQAFHHLINFQTVQDSLFNIESYKNIENIEGKYQNLKKEKENQLLQNENQLKDVRIKQQFRIGILLIVLALLALAILLLVYKSRERVRNVNILLKQKKQELEKQSMSLALSLDKQKELMQLNESIINMIVHDLKNPLNALINISAINDTNNKDELIQNTGRNMLNMVMNLLDVYKPDKEKLLKQTKEISLIDLLNKAVAEVDFLIESKMLNIKYPDSVDCKISLDESIIHRVLTNLLTNAIKFSPQKESIEIKIIPLKNNFVRISIINQGKGIKPVDQEIIFEKFSQLEKRDSGDVESSGLGLTFCKMAVEAHGGEIGVISETETGVEFWFTLPNSKWHQFKQKEDIHYESNSNNFTESEKKYLKGFSIALGDIEIFEISAINSILKTIEPKTKTIEFWLAELEKAVYSGNNIKYKELLKL